MTGILLLVVAAVWLVIANSLAKFITISFPARWWRTPVRVLVFIALLPLPLFDEIVGKRQFAQLCKDNSTIQVDRAKAMGKTVYLLDLPDIQIKGTWVPIRLQPWRYVDAKTGDPIVSYNIIHAKGGRLIRALGISEGNAPLIFENACAPNRNERAALFKELEITQINRP